MAKVKPGDLFEVNWPFTDQAGAKRRPAVDAPADIVLRRAVDDFRNHYEDYIRNYQTH
jgi:hypothetical protein